MQYVSKNGQNIYDVCLQTYGVLEHLLKLVRDNNLSSIGAPFFNKEFFFDEDLVKDYLLFSKVNNENINYITEEGFRGLLTDSGIQILTDDGFMLFAD